MYSSYTNTLSLNHYNIFVFGEVNQIGATQNHI